MTGAPPSWRRTVNDVLNGTGGGFAIAYQPICTLNDTRSVCGYEALSRFPRLPHLPPEAQTPDVWFATASALGLGEELEALAVSCAVRAVPLVAPAYVAVNVSANTILVPEFAELVLASMPANIVVELTEHDVVTELAGLKRVLEDLRGHEERRVGVKLARLAIDDVGAGYSGLSRIVDLRPDVLKLDRSLIANVDTSTMKGALIAGMVMFAATVGIALVAEGIETEAEFDALRNLGVDFGQGFLLGRPEPMEGLEPCRGPL